jgi:hypothetical protein
VLEVVLVAVTVAVPLGTPEGALYRPEDDIVPLALPPTTDQVTLELSLVVALNCCVAPAWTVALLGVTETVGAVDDVIPVPLSATEGTALLEFVEKLMVPV